MLNRQNWRKDSSLKTQLIILLFLFFVQTSFSLNSQPLQSELIDTPSPPTLSLSFEKTIGPVGEEISLPIQLKSDQKIDEPFTIILRFPPSKLEFKKLGIASQPRKEGWKLEVDLRKSPPAFDMSFLEIIATPDQGEFLPEGGLLAFIYFQILEIVPDHTLELTSSIKTISTSTIEVSTEPAIIMTLPEAMFACFFYMH